MSYEEFRNDDIDDLPSVVAIPVNNVILMPMGNQVVAILQPPHSTAVAFPMTLEMARQTAAGILNLVDQIEEGS